MIENNDFTAEINAWCVEKFRTLNRIISVDELKTLYNIDDMILVGTKNQRDAYSTLFEGTFGKVDKYYITTNNRLHSNGEIVIASKAPENVEWIIRHAYTTHAIQGETASHKLFIDSSKIFDPTMFYTAISRARTLEQIYIISGV
jgi:ATP-dependent exoDNAse (exonuclease V) alpha subunit